jgi:hypothetical protein
MDFYYQSVRLVPANVAWGAALLAVLAIGVWVSPVLGIVASPVLCLPLAGVTTLAAQIARGDDVVLSDFPAAMRRHGSAALALGAVVVAATVIFATNLVSGIAGGGPLDLAFATLAGWGLVITWTVAIAAWPLLVDPVRDGQPALSRIQLAGLVVLAEPLRFAGLTATVAVILLASLVAFAAILTVSVAFVALVAARIVLPAADELEARLGRGGVGGPA